MNGLILLNPLQFPTSIFMRMLVICSNSDWIAPNDGWMLLSEAWGSRLCKDLWELYEENEDSKRENFERVLEFLIWKVLLSAVMIRVSVFISHANDNANHIFHWLIMIKELWSNLQKCKMSSHAHNARAHPHVKLGIHSRATNGHDLKINLLAS